VGLVLVGLCVWRIKDGTSSVSDGRFPIQKSLPENPFFLWGLPIHFFKIKFLSDFKEIKKQVSSKKCILTEKVSAN